MGYDVAGALRAGSEPFRFVDPVAQIISSDPKPTFDRFGRSHHLQIRSADDLSLAVELDEALWVATSAPIAGLACDRVLLDLIDTNDDGRILVWEMRAAIRWTLRTLHHYEGLEAKRDTLSLAAVNPNVPEGDAIITAAQKMLDRLGKSEAGEISLAEIRQIKSQVETTTVSEGGVVLPETTEDGEIRTFLEAVIATQGGAVHPSGKPGVDQAKLDAFLADAEAHLKWRGAGQLPEGEATSPVMPLGEATHGAMNAVLGIRDKLEPWFAQSRAIGYDARLADPMGLSIAEAAARDLSDPAEIAAVLADAPLAPLQPTCELDLEGKINPHFADAIAALRTHAITPILGPEITTLTHENWLEIKRALAAHEMWRNSKAGASVESLGPDKLRQFTAPRFREQAEALIAESHTTAFVLENIRLTEKLALCQHLLIDLANNYVSFPHLYEADARAMFERGTLVMDGRRFNLAVKVEDRAAHAAITKTSNMFVMYVELQSKHGPERMEVVVPVTSGGQGNLVVGKRGIFVDTADNEWDARVAQIIDNPISLREAIAAPFIRLGELLTGKIEAMTGQAEKALDQAGTKVFTQVTETPATTPAPAPASGPSGSQLGGILFGGGIAIAALGSAAAYIAKTIAGMQPITLVALLIGAILAVLVPTTIVAILKLRKRDLSTILEGSDWAINARMRLTFPQSRFFTKTPDFPPGSRGVVRRKWWLTLIYLAVVAAIALPVGLMLGEMIGRWWFG